MCQYVRYFITHRSNMVPIPSNKSYFEYIILTLLLLLIKKNAAPKNTHKSHLIYNYVFN